MSASKDTQKSARSATNSEESRGFTAAEKAAMKERAKELTKDASRSRKKAAGESDLLEKIAEMPEPDRSMAERIHALVRASAPDILPKTWYGMPSYANKDGKIVFFFQAAAKFGARYATIGFNDAANLDEGAMWPVAYALKELTPAVEEQIAMLVKKAVS